jgi:hypothetical protein
MERGFFIFAIIVMGLMALTGNAAAQADIGMFGLGLVMCVLILVIVPIVIAILVGIWMYRDANKRGMSGILWLLLLIGAAFLFNFIGFIIIIIIYLVVRKPELPPGGYPPPGPGGYPPPPGPGGYPPPPPGY